MDVTIGWDKVVVGTACAIVFKVLAPIAEAFGERGRAWVRRRGKRPRRLNSRGVRDE